MVNWREHRGKKGKLCDMFEKACWIPKPRVTPMRFFSYRLLSFLLVLFQRLLRQKKDLTYPALPYFAWNFLRTPHGERGERILNGPPFAASIQRMKFEKTKTKVGKGRTYFQNWSVAWPPSPSEDMARKKCPIVFKEAPWQRDSSTWRAKGFAAN